LRELFIKCKIKPTLFDYFSGDNEEWDQDQEYYEYRIWKDGGGHHQAYLNGKCNATKNCGNDAIYTRLHNDEFDENCCCEEHKDKRAYSNSKLTSFIPKNLRSFL
jgi:hypothetical protein